MSRKPIHKATTTQGKDFNSYVAYCNPRLRLASRPRILWAATWEKVDCLHCTRKRERKTKGTS